MQQLALRLRLQVAAANEVKLSVHCRVVKQCCWQTEWSVA